MNAKTRALIIISTIVTIVSSAIAQTEVESKKQMRGRNSGCTG